MTVYTNFFTPPLLNEASALRQSAEIRTYVDAVRAANASAVNPLPPEKIEAWATWALAEADRIDPIRSGRFLGQVKKDGPRAGALVTQPKTP